MTPAKPGPKPRDPAALRTVIVRVYLTPGEAARLDAARGVVERCVWVREVTMGAARNVMGAARDAGEVCDG